MTLNIGFDGHVLTGRFQGTRTTLASLLRAIGPKIGSRRIVIYADDPNAASNLVGSNEFEYRKIPPTGSVGRLLWVFPTLFRRHQVDIGVFQYITPLSGRNIVFIHDILPITHPHLFPFRMRIRTEIFFRLAIYRARLVVTVSDYTKSEILRVFRLPNLKICTVLNGPSFPEHVYTEDRDVSICSYILVVGRIEPRKNIPLLVQAFVAAKVKDVKLIIVGSRDLDFQYDFPDVASIELRSGIADEQLINLYKGASLFVYPSEAEGFGVPLLDAILFGIPTICSNKTAMIEVGADLVKYFNPTDTLATTTLSELIRGHFEDQPIAAPTASQRRDHASRFSWDRAADEFLDAVDRLDE